MKAIQKVCVAGILWQWWMLNGSAHDNNDSRERGEEKKDNRKYLESNVSRDKLLLFILLTVECIDIDTKRVYVSHRS